MILTRQKRFILAPFLLTLSLSLQTPGQTGQSKTAQAQSPKPSRDANKAEGQTSETGKPNDTEFQRAMETGDLFARSGRYIEALRQFQQAAELHRDNCPECYSRIAQSYIRMGAYDQGVAAVKRALQQKPDDVAALTNMLGVALYLQGGKDELAQAIDAFHQAIALSKDSLSQPYFNMGYALIKLGRTDEGIAALKEYVKRSPKGANAYEAKVVIANPSLAGEQIAPDFKVKTTTGQEVSVESYRGRILLLDFWASWCGPCREEMPSVKAVWQKYKSDRFVILGIDLDQDRAAFERYVKSEGITWPQYLDVLNGGPVASLYGVEAIPHSILIDQDGVIRGVELSGPELYEKVGELLNKLDKAAGKQSQNRN